jgi:hypothetical protein
MQIYKTIIEFIRAVGKWWWWVVVEEAIGILIGTIQTFGHWSNLPKWVAPLLLIFGLVFACFVAFHRLRLERDEAVKNLHENQPNFKGHLIQMGFGNLGNPEIGNMAGGVLVKMTITNRGTPSVARNFRVFCQLASGNKIPGMPVWNVTGDMPLFSGGDKTAKENLAQILHRELYLPSVAMTPIPKGGEIFGYLSAQFRGMTRDEVGQNGNKIIVEFEDVTEKHITCEYVVEGDSGTLVLHPGEYK